MSKKDLEHLVEREVVHPKHKMRDVLERVGEALTYAPIVAGLYHFGAGVVKGAIGLHLIHDTFGVTEGVAVGLTLAAMTQEESTFISPFDGDGVFTVKAQEDREADACIFQYVGRPVSYCVYHGIGFGIGSLGRAMLG